MWRTGLDTSRRPRLLVALAMLASSLSVYWPFRDVPDKILRYWDGPAYLYVAKTLYRVPLDHQFQAYELPRAYFANHLPLFPLVIRALSPLTLGNYPAAMILAVLATSVLAALLFHELLRSQALVASPAWTAVLFCLLPPRWLIYHAVGATEPLFFCLLFAAFLALNRERHTLVLVAIGLAALTRIVGVLLVPAFMLVYLQRGEWRRAARVPAALVGVLTLFAYYKLVFGDFFAYFTWNLGSAGIVSPRPFEILQRYVDNSGTKFHSAELFASMYVAYGLGTLALWRKRRDLFWFCLVYFVFSTFVTHHDLPRYMAVLAPFALLVAFDAALAQPACRLILPLLLYVDYVSAWTAIPTKLVAPDVYAALLKVLAR